jgi:hypothetical protein
MRQAPANTSVKENKTDKPIEDTDVSSNTTIQLATKLK